LINQLLHKLTPSQLFLTDSIGALLSVATGLIVSRFEKFFGVPPQTMYILACIAAVFFIFSFLCFLRRPKQWRPLMKMIATANMLYCCLAIGVITYLWKQVTGWGLTFFFVEIVLVALLASAEFKKARQ
jgi:O-antigen/teichoic acid export membrane protein